MGWNQRARGLAHAHRARAVRQLRRASIDDRVVGTAIGIDYGHCGWIAMMLVAPGVPRPWSRARGCSRRRWPQSRRSCRFGSTRTPLGRPLYERHGFVLETSLTRHVRPAGAPAPTAANEVVQLPPADLPEVATIDAADLRRHAAPGCSNASTAAGPEYAWRAGGAPIRTCLGRTGRLFNQIGPIAATTAADARSHSPSAALPSARGTAVVVDAYDDHEDFTAWLRVVRLRSAAPALSDAAGLARRLQATGHGCAP